jgi:hypothetical protein
VNYSPDQGQCYAPFPAPLPANVLEASVPCDFIHLRDWLGDTAYERERASLLSPGLFLDLPGWGVHVFELSCSHPAEPTFGKGNGE